jgi:predicted nucleotide-binding protein
MAKLKFYGDFEDLKAYVLKSGLHGEWSEASGHKKFLARTREIIHFYDNGTVIAQGVNSEKTTSLLEALCSGAVTPPKPDAREQKESPKIFIVHGHDEAARNELELILRRLNLSPYILQSNSGAGRTIVEALEDEITKESAFGIVLLTPDDVGYAQSDGSTSAKPRARQNVILELGMVMAALSRSRTVILKKKGDLELPSDNDGILRLEFERRVQEQVAGLVQRLRDAGIDADPSLIADASR